MTSSADADRPSELTDGQLDQLLDAASEELLDYLRGTADPSRTLTAIMADGSPRVDSPQSALGVEPLAPVVTYAPTVVRGGLGRWVVSVTLTSNTDCVLPSTLLVLGTGSRRPTSPRDGEVVCEIPASLLTASKPLVVSFETRLRRGSVWLVCLPVDPSAPGADLKPAAPHKLLVQ